MKKPKKPTKKTAKPLAPKFPAPVQPSAARTPGQLGTLYLVPTPIGNLGDITQRALDVLKSVDAIASEDTRNTGLLLSHFGIKKELMACHDHNEVALAPKLITRLQSGESIALVSDAGTPLVSDPGYRVVAAAIAANLPITALPGANAILPALQLSGLPPHPFYFGGFLPTRSKARQNALRSVKELPATLIFYEAPHRLPEMLADAASVLGTDRRAAVMREISKKFEEARRGPLFMLRDFYARNEVRGEIVVVIDGTHGLIKWSEEMVREALTEGLKSGAPFREAVVITATEAGWPKREVYDMALKLKTP